MAFFSFFASKLGLAILGAFTTAGSIYVQRRQAAKARERFEDENGLDVRLSAAGEPIKIQYGRSLANGIAVWVGTGDNLPEFTTYNTGGDQRSISSITAESGDNNDFAFAQFILSAQYQTGADYPVLYRAWSGDFEIVATEDSDDQVASTQLYGEAGVSIHRGNTHSTDAVAFCSTAEGTGGAGNGTGEITERALFTGLIYADAAFKWNDDQPKLRSETPQLQVECQWGSPPYVKLSGSNYELDQEGVNLHSNVVRVLLDFLTSENYGTGFKSRNLDLESFFFADQVANSHYVGQNAATGNNAINNHYPKELHYLDDFVDAENGTSAADYLEAHGLPTDRDGVIGSKAVGLRRYEFNGSVDTISDFSSSIEQILTVAPGFILFRSASGKWKLSIPRGDISNAEQSVGDIDDSKLVGGITVSYPDSKTKLNQIECTFANRGKNFGRDTVIFPHPNSAALQGLVNADGGRLLSTRRTLHGVTNPYQAASIAGTLIALSRRPHYRFTVGTLGLILEPGDVVLLSSELSGVEPVYVRIEESDPTERFTWNIQAVQFEYYDYIPLVYPLDLAPEGLAAIELNPITNLMASVPEPQRVLPVPMNITVRKA